VATFVMVCDVVDAIRDDIRGLRDIDLFLVASAG